MSETKTVQRFWTPEVQELSRRLKEEQMKRAGAGGYPCHPGHRATPAT